MSDTFDLIILGFGSGGIAAAEMATKLRLRVAVVERDRPGGDCLWTGCVPSKALLASAKLAHEMRTADRLGLPAHDPVIDTVEVLRRVRSVQDGIAAHSDDPERFRQMGIDLVIGTPTVTSPRTVSVGGRTLRTKRILLATGSRALVPPIPGLDESDPLTAESFWGLDRLPSSMVMIGGGPIAVELAQALNRLGVAVDVLEMADRILPRDEPRLVDTLRGVLEEEGVRIHTSTAASSVERVEGGVRVHTGDGSGGRSFDAERVLVAAGRRPNVEGLGLEEVGVAFDERGVLVLDDLLRTSVDTIHAAGDVAGREQFTHAAAYQAMMAVRNMFFPGTETPDATIPWATFTDPELAHAGMTSEEARRELGEGVEVWHRPVSDNDRARTDGHTVGDAVLVTHKNKIVGGHLLGPGAGDLINEVSAAIQHGTRVTRFATSIRVYPSNSTLLNLLAGDAAFNHVDKVRWLTKFVR